jgi:serine/threonine protein kinase
MTSEALQLPGPGDVVGDGRFELGRQLGEGGMSTVFVAVDRQLGREVALKLLTPRYVGRPARELRFINEAEFLRRVSGHPHIIEFVDTGRLHDRRGWPWLSTEILHGDELNWLFVAGKIAPARVIALARQIADALQACHAAGVVHRDLTPNNLFLLGDQRTIKLFDFSHAADLWAPKLAAGAPERLTGIFEAPGTAGYMAPEQAAGAAADERMDVFGFGVLLFQLITGRSPYRQYGDREAFIRAQREGALEPPRLHAWAYDVPEELAAVVHDCTQRDVEARPTMAEVVGRLASIEITDAEPTDTEPDTETDAEPTDATLRVEQTAEVFGVIEAAANDGMRRDPEREYAAASGEIETTPTIDAQPTTDAQPLVDATLDDADRTDVELPFARPPHLRGGEPPSDEPPARRHAALPPGESGVAEGPSGEFPGEEDERNLTEPERRPRAIGRWIGTALITLMILLSVLVLAHIRGNSATEREGKSEGARDQTTASHHYQDEGISEAAVAGDADSADRDTGDGDTDTGGETGGTSAGELVPEVKVEPTVAPKNPKNPPASVDCDGVEQAAAAAAADYDWSRLAKLTKRKSCWSSSKEWTYLRVKSTWETGQTKECLKAGARSTDPEVQKIVELCRDFTD